MGRKFDAEAYLFACKDGDEMVQFCLEHNITKFAELFNMADSFPEEKKETWVKHLCSPGFVRFLHTRGIR